MVFSQTWRKCEKLLCNQCVSYLPFKAFHGFTPLPTIHWFYTVLANYSSPHRWKLVMNLFFHLNSFDYQYQWVIRLNLVTVSNAVGGGGGFRLPQSERGIELCLSSMTKVSEICEPPKIGTYRVKELFSLIVQRSQRAKTVKVSHKYTDSAILHLRHIPQFNNMHYRLLNFFFSIRLLSCLCVTNLLDWCLFVVV